MKAFLCLASLLVAFVYVSTPSAQTGADYYPLKMGNSWIFTISHPGGAVAASDTARREVAVFQAEAESSLAGVKNKYSGMSESYQWFKTDSKGKIVLISISAGPDQSRALMDFNPPIILLPDKPSAGATWEMKMSKDDSTVFMTGTSRVESTEETVTVPAGTFRNCLKVKLITFDGNGTESSTSLLYYAKGVGEVLSEITVADGKKIREELVGYTIK